MALSDRLEKIQTEKARVAGVKPSAAPEKRRKIVSTGSGSWGQMKRQVRDSLMEELGNKLYAKSNAEELKAVVSENLEAALNRAGIVLPSSQRPKFVAELTADLLGYGPLEELLSDPTITEIMCNGYNDIFVEKKGKLIHTDIAFTDEAHLRQVIEKIVATVGRRIDEASPMVDARLPDGSRVNAMLPPVAVDSPILTIRRFPAKPFTIHDLIRLGAITEDAGAFLEGAVLGKLNIVVSGGTGTGKTTLLNILGDFVPPDERIVTIEDAAEIRLSQPHVVRMESRPANIEGAGHIGIRELVRNALRMRPDRIVVGEVRGGEALDMLQAMNTGHEGSLTTIHSNSPRDALTRLDTMVMMAGYDLPVRAIRQQVAAALDLVVQIARFGDGSRRITHISEIQGMEGDIITLQDIFRYSFAEGGSASATSSGILKPTGLRPKVIEKLQDKGVDLPAKLFRPKTEQPAVPARLLSAANGRRPVR
ncbi:MAG TPA: CpaF family protein [Actinomycetota bacterium]|nr:CpaF family protein [Actinomycetota bacterium]